MKLTYWYSQCPHDSDAYSARFRTRREALAHIAAYGEGWDKPIKVTVVYANAMDLVQQCTGEGRLYWEAQALHKRGASDEPICCKFATAGIDEKLR